MLSLPPKQLKKQRRGNCKPRLRLLIGRIRLRKLRLSQEDNRPLLPPNSKPRRLSLRLKDRDK